MGSMNEQAAQEEALDRRNEANRIEKASEFRGFARRGHVATIEVNEPLSLSLCLVPAFA